MTPKKDRGVPVRWQTLAVMVALMLLVNFASGAWSPSFAFAAPTAGPEADKTEEPAPDDRKEEGTTSAAAPISKAKSKKGTAQKKHQPPKLSPGQQVNLNTASQGELEKLPCIGPKRAQAIIKGRPYKSLLDIMKVRGIKKGTYQKLKDFITVN